ncbi:MAG: SMP-30/gluconolactonase/LRE family protein [Candidatus Marinimicrobia bacterium]|nr:SMP-30/gluconolactonase/LRE family protein [Candidatus Neomarinimicrobiota bacterium]
MNSLLSTATIFADGLDHPECVAVHPDGTIWAGGEGGQIYRISKAGKKVEEVANTGGFILGIAFSPGGKWLAICDLNNHCLWKLDVKSYELTKFSEGVEKHAFNIPNYAIFDKSGNLYVSESGAFREITGKIIKYSTNGSGSIWHAGPFNFANGLALDQKQNFLYVVSSWLPGVERVVINPDGSAGERSVYCTLPETVPDGIAFDAQGNLLVSCYTPNRIFKIAPDQTATVLVDDWEAHALSNPTNITFGGPAFDQLFVANLGRWHVLRIDYGSKGLPLASLGS